MSFFLWVLSGILRKWTLYQHKMVAGGCKYPEFQDKHPPVMKTEVPDSVPPEDTKVKPPVFFWSTSCSSEVTEIQDWLFALGGEINPLADAIVPVGTMLKDTGLCSWAYLPNKILFLFCPYKAFGRFFLKNNWDGHLVCTCKSMVSARICGMLRNDWTFLGGGSSIGMFAKLWMLCVEHRAIHPSLLSVFVFLLMFMTLKTPQWLYGPM